MIGELDFFDNIEFVLLSEVDDICHMNIYGRWGIQKDNSCISDNTWGVSSAQRFHYRFFYPIPFRVRYWSFLLLMQHTFNSLVYLLGLATMKCRNWRLNTTLCLVDVQFNVQFCWYMNLEVSDVVWFIHPMPT